MYKKILSWLLTFIMVFSMFGGVSLEVFGQSFKDIEDHWAKETIENWSDKELIKGYKDGSFKPDSEITRAEFITLVNETINAQIEEDINFKDVSKEDWFYSQLKKAVYSEYILGYEDKSFRPENPVTRQEVAVILENLVQLELKEEDSLENFNDATDIPAWSRDALQLAVQRGYLSGYKDNSLKASNYITRAESVKVLSNLFGVVYNKAGVYGPNLDEEALQIEGNLTISAEDVILQNMIINGDLYLAEGIDQGDIILDNVTVLGDTILKGGGENSITIKNSSLENLFIIKKDGKIRIVLEGDTNIKKTYVRFGVLLENEISNQSSFGDIEIIEVKPLSSITFKGNFKSIDVKTTADINITGKSKVEKLNIHKNTEDVKIKVSQDSVIDKLYSNTKIYVDNGGSILEALGDFAKISTYDNRLPVNLQPKPSRRSSSSSSSSSPDTYTVSFDSQGGTAVSAINVTEGESIDTSPSTTRADYDFDGWFTDPTGGTEISFPFTPNEDTTLYAQWTLIPVIPETYTVAFESQGGTAVSPMNITEGDYIDTSPSTTKDGYNFKGWFADSTGGTEIVFPFTPDEDTSLYAQWTLIPVVPKYNLSLSVSPAGSGRVSGAGNYSEGKNIAIRATANEGYEFLNWTDGGTEVSTSSAFNFIMPSKNKTLTANFKASSVPSDFEGGSGTESDPYQVANAEQLNRVRDYLDAHFIQTADIDLGVSPWNDGEGWEPIGTESKPFIGSYNGDDYNIASLYIDRPDSSYQGLFGSLKDGTIKNLHLKTVNITGYMLIGGLVGYLNNGNIKNCSSTGTVYGTHNTIGGLVGYNYFGSINESFSKGTVKCDSGTVGGLVGRMYKSSVIDSFSKSNVINTEHTDAGGLVGSIDGDNSSVTNCYATGSVNGDRENGGLVGRVIGKNILIKNSYSTGLVAGNTDNGGLIGKLYVDPTILISNCYYDSETSNQSDDSGKGTPKTTAEMKELSTYAEWNFPNTWTINSTDNNGYPALNWQGFDHEGVFAGGSGTGGDPYQVATADQLNKVRDYLDAHFIQIADIDLGVSPWNDGEGWIPIGTKLEPFTGSYNGNAYSIRDLHIVRSEEDYQGLFGYADKESKLFNINLSEAYVHGDGYVGSLAGSTLGETENCSSTLVQILCEDSYAGGLIGQNMGTIVDSWTTGIVKCGYSVTGGLVGYNYKNINSGYDGKITNCYSEAQITYLSLDENEVEEVGGLVGYNSSGVIKNSRSIGDVTGHEEVGGLIGVNSNGTVEACYSTGNVNGLTSYEGDTSSYTGGLIGNNRGDGVVTDCYARGSVSGGYSVGGLVGDNNSTIKNSYHKIGTVTGSDNIGGLVGKNSGMITESYSESNVSGIENIGGLVGYSSSGEIKYSYTIGNVSASSETAGGLVGSAQSTSIHDCYATGNISGPREVGGLAGSLSIGSAVYNCYSTGLVSGSSYIGGLIGAKTAGTPLPTVNDSYYDSETSNQSDTGKGTPKTTAEMKTLSTYESWDFTDIWNIDEGNSYPYLRNNEQVPHPQPINRAPTSTPTSFTVAEGSIHSGLVTGTDSDGDPLTFATETGPVFGSLTLNSDGRFSYSADRQPTMGFMGTDTFSFRTHDGDAYSEPGTVTITITQINDAPVAEAKSFTVERGATYSGQVSATDVDGDALTFTLVTGPSLGTLTFNANGSFSYIQNTDDPEENDSFIFKANDGSSDSNNATVTISINTTP